MRIAILTANLGNFDTPTDPAIQDYPTPPTFMRWTDQNFPPIVGLTPRLQYRIPKLFGWEMLPGFDIYIWLDGSVSLKRSDCIKWYLEQLGDNDMAFFRHPQRGTMKQEVEHIEEKLKLNHWYITPRYKNGLHREQLDMAMRDETFKDENLYASTAFIYRDSPGSREVLRGWWYLQSRYYTCDQVNLPYAIHMAKDRVKVKKIPDNLFKIGYLSLVSHHK